MFSGLLVPMLVLSQAAPSLGVGRAYVATLQKGKGLERTWAHNAKAPGQRFESFKAFQKFAAGVRSYGEETKLVSEGLSERSGTFVYTRVMAVKNWARGISVEVTMDRAGRLINAALGFATKEAPTAYGTYRSQVKLRLPLEDTWHVLWGGRTWNDNRHASVSDMRFALDLLQRKNGSSSQGRGSANEDYFAWNQPVLAPADGVVVVAQDGSPDAQPGHPSGGNLYGNLLVIDHGRGEFTLLGHLKQGSLAVHVGDRVVRAQRIARVGNSGMSTEPHLHFHLMDTGDWKTANGLPLALNDFVRNGSFVDRAEPRRGDVLTPIAIEAHR
jgi:murein DD-endopeptidase MepM/ murein hydrolase activator NlpD